MASESTYKNKYLALKQKFIDSIDASFRMGYEQGMKEAQLDQMNQMAAQQQEAPAQETVQPEAQEVQQQNPMGSELEQHINELDSIINKSEDLDIALVKSHLDSIKALSKIPSKLNIQKVIAATEKPKKEVSAQEKVVKDIMKAWEEEEKAAPRDIMDILSEKGLLKK